MSQSKQSKQSTIANESETKQIRRPFKRSVIKTLFTPRRNPFELDPRIKVWANQVFEISLISENKWEKMVKGTTMFPVYFYPMCSDVKRFENLIKMYLLFFLFDDHTECRWGDVAYSGEMARAVWGQAISALEKIADPNKDIKMDGWKPYVKYWYLVINDICQALNEVSKRRLLRLFKEYSEGNIAESKAMETQNPFKDVEEMIQIRRDSIGVNAAYALIEYSEDISLTDEEWDEIEELLSLSTYCITYDNDIASFEKEWLDQDKDLNKVMNVVAKTSLMEDIPIEEAMKKIATKSEECEERVLKMVNLLLERNPSKDMKAFIEGVGLQIAGNYQASLELDRYNKLYE